MKKIFFATLMLSVLSYGSGYEKSILWGAKYSGVAGAAAAGVQGADSVFYNPAGLVNSSMLGEIGFNLSQSNSQFKGPIVPNASVVNPGPTATLFTNAEKQESSISQATTIPAVTYSMKLSDSFSYGLGYYAVGGTRAKYEDIDFSPRTFKAKVGSEVTISEFAAGIGYKVADNFRLGLVLRYTMVEAGFSSVSYTQSTTAPLTGAVTSISNIEIKDIKSSKLDSVRLGAQYDLSESTKFGLVVRTETKFDGTGKASGSVNTCANASCAAVATINVAEADAKVESVLPMAINLGVEHKLNEDWNLLAEYVYTQYSKVDKVPVSGTITVGSTPKSLTDIQQQWKDQTNLKLAGEYKGISWPVRFGYVYTSQVSDSDYARASFTPPGTAATYTLGTGHDFKVGDSTLEFNIAADLTTVKGDSNSPSADSLVSPKGTYEANSSALHTGLQYRF